jgi:hypothetical protein
MRARFWLIAGLLLLSGCAGKQSAGRAAKLQAWLDRQHYSSWETFCGPNGKLPRKPDGFTLGNHHIFAGIGCAPTDLSQIEPLFGFRKSARALPAPLVFALQRGGAVTPLSRFDDQRLQRVARSGIIVGSSKSGAATVTLVDFAPTAPERNALVRLVIVKNLGERSRFSLLFSGVFADITQLDGKTLLINNRLGLTSDINLRARPADNRTEIILNLGAIGKGQGRCAALAFVPGPSQSQVTRDLKPVKKLLSDPLSALEATRAEWSSWCHQVEPESGTSRREELIDSLFCLIRSHLGFKAIHTGSLRYPHNRAWVRDNYWVGRALWEAGLKNEAKMNLDFFFSAWRQSGLASYYDISSGKGFNYGNMQVELPHYLVLMVKDGERWGGIDPRPYWPMVKDCLNRSQLAPNGLQPVNGDESWLLAANIDPLEYVLDNSLLFIAAQEYGANLARRMGDLQAAEKYSALAQRARREMESWFPDSARGSFAAGVSGEGKSGREREAFPVSGALARLSLLGAFPPGDPRLRAGLDWAWDNLNYAEGVRAYSRSNIVDGGTPGYLLYAAAEAGLGFDREMEKRVTGKFCSATGCVWELQSARDPQWGGEKRRLWDSAVLLLGLLHQNKFPAPTAFRPAASGSVLARLLEASPQLSLVENRSAAPARELATQLARYYSVPVALIPWTGKFPGPDNYIFLSPSAPALPSGAKPQSTFAGDNYQGWTIDLGADRKQIIVWVKNRGEVFSDLQGVNYDLFRSAFPRRQPAPYPQSDLELAKLIGEKPAGTLPVAVICPQPITIACGRQNGKASRGEFSLDLAASESPAPANLQISTKIEDEKIVVLHVAANPGPETTVKAAVTFPAGWWLLETNQIQAGWNRLADPIDEIHRSDGGRTYLFSVTFPRKGGKAITLRFARPGILPSGVSPSLPAPAPPPPQYPRRPPGLMR